jgi:hypothetical protein
MKSLVKSPSLLALSLVLVTASSVGFAQNTPSSAPPKMEKIEEFTEPAITISKPEPGKAKMVEKRVNGKVTEVQVKSGKSTYVVKANPEIGNAPKGTVQGDVNRGAQWTVMEFGGKKESKEVEKVPTLQPAPAPASAPSAASLPNKK